MTGGVAGPPEQAGSFQGQGHTEDPRIEAAAIALYEHTRGHVYSGTEWDWPNIDTSYDRDDEDEYPEGAEPDPSWLRNRFRREAQVALAALADPRFSDQVREFHGDITDRQAAFIDRLVEGK